MASAFPDGLEDCIETRLNRATNPLQVEENWEYIVAFCDMINKDIDGPQTAVRLITHKIQSPQEKESLFALTCLEACVKNCGLRFQQEIGKFRFINEIIKVISPKYLGNHMSTKVKQRCIKLLLVWSESLKHEPKISEAYQMLKKQGIVKEDPVLDASQAVSSEKHAPPPQSTPTHPPPSNDKNQIFNDAEKSKLLSKLLKSKNPEDLQAANRLIKSMVKQDEERVEKVTRRTQQLETVMNNVKLLNDMLKNYQPLNSNESDVEIMKELSENIEKQRPALFKLASDSDEKDSSGAIGEILKVNDEVIQVLSTYDSLINHSTVGKLLLLDNDASGDNKNKPVVVSSPETPVSTTVKAASSSLLDEQLLSLDLSSVAQTTLSLDTPTDLNSIFSTTNASDTSTLTSNLLPSNPPSYIDLNLLDILKTPQQPYTPPTTTSSKYHLYSDSFNISIDTTTATSTPSSSSGLDVLNNMLVKTLQESGLNSQVKNNAKKMAMKEISKTSTEAPKPSATITNNTETTNNIVNATTNDLLNDDIFILDHRPQNHNTPQKHNYNGVGDTTESDFKNNNFNVTMDSNVNTLPNNQNVESVEITNCEKSNEVKPLTDVSVSLQSFKPGKRPSREIYNKDGITCRLYFSDDRPREDVALLAMATTNTSSLPIEDFTLLTSVSKGAKVKVQAPASKSLQAFNPILPPPLITHLVLIAYPNHESIKLKYTISFLMDDNIVTEIGEVNDLKVN